MPKPFDAVTKRLIDAHPGDWLKLVGVDADGVEPLDPETLDTDISTVTGQADRVLRVLLPEPNLHHFELETGHHGANRAKWLLRTSVLLTDKYDLPVRSTLFLLRREADSPTLTGNLVYRHGQSNYLSFTYHVVRVWQLRVETLLAGGIGTLPLAPLATVSTADLPGVVRHMARRFEAETEPEEQEELWTSTRILLGLRVKRQVANDLLKGVRHMRDSDTYMEILEEGEARGEAKGEAKGKIEEALHLLLRLGGKRLGSPSARIQEQLAEIQDVERLEQLIERVFEIESWSELL